LYLFVLVSIVVTLIGAEHRMARPDRAFAIGVSANVVGAIVASLVATWLEIFPNEFYLWLLATIAFTAARPESA
jgi:hypothetical protein